jgi:Tol biopolymer transport system component
MKTPKLLALLLALATPLGAQTLDPATSMQAFMRVAEAWSGHMTPRFDPASGRLIEAVGRVHVAPFGVDAKNVEGVARTVARELEPLLGVSASELFVAYRSEVAGLFTVQLERRIGGIPVEGSRLDLRFLEDGHLLFVRARGLWTGDVKPTFVVDRELAGELARVAVPSGSTEAWAHQPRQAILAASEGRPAVSVWIVSVDDPAGGGYEIAIDGVDGTVIDIHSRHVHADSIDGKIEGRSLIDGPKPTGSVLEDGLAHMVVTAIDPTALHGALTADFCEDTDPDVSGDGSTVVWVKECSPAELWIASFDGTGITALVSNGADNYAPSISYDGTIIWFVSEIDGDPEIFRIASDGSGLLQLTSNSAVERAPSLAYDGSFGVFESKVDGDSEIFKINDDGSGLTQLTTNAAIDADPELAGDGAALVFSSNRDGDFEIFSMDADGTDEMQLTFNDETDVKPVISADGMAVAFLSSQPEIVASGGTSASGPGHFASRTLPGPRPPRAFQVWGVASDGSGLTALTGPKNQHLDVAISGDGGTIVYAVREKTSADWELEGLSLPGGAPLRLTDDVLDQRRPSLSHTGSKGAYEQLESDREIYVFDVAAPGAVAQVETGVGGTYSLPVTGGTAASVSARLAGPFVRVKSKSGGNARVGTSAVSPAAGVDMHYNPTPKKKNSSETKFAQITAFYQTNLIHDYLEAMLTGPKLGLPSPLPIDGQLETYVNVTPPVANAFFDPATERATYYHSGSGFENGSIDTVIYHEYGHWADHAFGGITSGTPCETPFAMSEGLADALTMSASGGTVIGKDFFGPGVPIREYSVPPFDEDDKIGSKGRQWDCLDCKKKGGLPEEHFHGQAFGGFFDDLRGLIGGILAEELLAGVIAANPIDQPVAVTECFMLAATPAFGGFGDPTMSPLYPSLCKAAVKHGFTCPPAPDRGSHGCVNAFCGPTVAMHQTVGTEWLGSSVTGWDPMPCNGIPDPDDDGLSLPPAIVGTGGPIVFPVTMSCDTSLQFTGRYGGTTIDGKPNRLRHVYLNAWLFVDDGMGGFIKTKIAGTGNMAGAGPGPAGFGTKIDGSPASTLAFNPDAWFLGTDTYPLGIPFPPVAMPTPAIVRLRLDYGEDSGEPLLAAKQCLKTGTLSEECGIALFGEVEDHHIWLMP